MLLIHKITLKELTVSFVLAVIFLNLTLMMESMLRLTRLISGIGAELADILQIVLYIQPQLLLMSIPMAILISSLLVYGRMQNDNELLIIRSCGVSFWGIITPAFYIGLGCLILTIFVSFYLAPLGSGKINKKLFEILTQKSALTIEEGIFNTAFKNIVILVKHKPSANELRDIFLLDDKNPDEQKVIVAKSGIIQAVDRGINFRLTDGSVTMTGQSTITQLKFASYTFTLNISFDEAVKQTNEMTPFELYELAQINPPKRLQALIDLHRRFTFPAMCLLVSIIGPTIAILYKKTGRLGGLVAGLAVFVSYYTLLLYGESLVKSQQVPHFVGSWLSLVVHVVATVALVKRASKD